MTGPPHASRPAPTRAVEPAAPVATVLHLMKRYQGNYPLLNAMVATDPSRFRTLVCYLSGAPDGNNQLEQLVARTLYLQLDEKSVRWTRWRTLRAVARVIDTHAVDLLVCQFRRTHPIGAFATLFARRKPRVIAIYHGIVGGKVSPRLRLLNWFVFRRLARLVSVSAFDVGEILRMNWGLAAEKVVAIQNGMDLQRFVAPIAAARSQLFGASFANKFLFGTVGRLAAKKNHARLLEAFAQARRGRDDLGLVIVGTGAEEGALRTLAARLGVTDEVLFAGRRSDIPALLHGLDVFVFPSLREGLPLALIEAMAAGLPVVAAGTGGTGETLGEADCGWRVDPTETDALAAALGAAAATSAAQRRQLGANGRRHALAQFNAGRMIAAYQRLYEEVLRGR